MRIPIRLFLGMAGALCLAARAYAQPVTIDLWGLVEARIFYGTYRAIEEFEKRNPDIRVSVGTPGGQGDLDPQKLLTAIVARTPPDVVWFGRHNTGLWAPRGAFRPLDDFIARDGVDISEYYPGTIREVRWEDRIYALPWNVDCRVLFCNMETLRGKGFEHPPSSWGELRDMAVALTHYNSSQGRYDLLGFAPNYGNAWLYLYGWQNGAGWVSPDSRQALYTAPELVEALEWVTGTYDAVGGAEKVAAFQGSAQIEGIGDPFMSGRLAMQTNGNYFLDSIARLKPDMDFEVAPPPMPTAGTIPISWSGGFSWVIPTDAKHPEEAWEFIRWMNSEEAWVIMSDAQEAFAKREWGKHSHFVPQYSANRAINERLVARYSPALPERYQRANQVCLDLLPNCMFRPVSPACNELWDAQDRAATDAAFHVRTPLETLEIQQRRVQSALDRFFQPSGGREFDPGQVAAGILVALMVLLGAGAAWFLISLRQIRGLARRRAIQGVVFVLPWLAGLFVFVLGPMIASAFLAFTEYDVIHPPRWVGTGNWARMFGLHQGSEGLAANDPQFWRGLWNTFYITLAGVPVGMAVSLAIALLLKAEVRGIHLYRTLYYVPVMVPAVVTALIWMWMLNPESGFANFALNRLLHPLGLSAPNWFGDPEWAKPGLILLLVWGCGGTVIIWLAGLHTLPRHLYEAATIDGAGSWRRFLHITLPLLTPYILFLWIMGTIGSLQIFAQAYIINPPGDSLLFYAVYLFFRAFRYFEMGYACAMAWVLFVITAFICIWQIRVSKRWVHYETEL